MENDMMDVEQKYPYLWNVVEEIAKKSSFQKKAVMGFLKSADKRYFEFAEDLVKRMMKVVNRDDGIQYIAETYLQYTKTIRIEEMYFSKKGTYRYSDYEEVYKKVYSIDDYMFDYVVGLGMTQIFWPNHWNIFKFFIDHFIPKVREFESGAEIGVGHGIFHSEFLRSCPNMRSKLLDVSPTSLATTKKMIEATGLDTNRIEIVRTDIQKEIPINDMSLDALLMGELIEHIEKGEYVMNALTKKMKKNGFCYFSTAANSPAEDHILLFKTVSEIRDFIGHAGWEIMNEHLGTLNNLSVEESESRGSNINYAAVLAVR